jgi:hypothetical protein
VLESNTRNRALFPKRVTAGTRDASSQLAMAPQARHTPLEGMQASQPSVATRARAATATVLTISLGG